MSRKIILFLSISLIALTSQAQVAAEFGIVRQAPIFTPGKFRLPPQFGIKLGYGWGGTSEDPFFGVKCSFYMPVTDTFSALGRTSSRPGNIPVLCTRRTTGFGIHFPFSFGFYRTEFLNFYGGLDIGVLFGSSIYAYTSDDYDNVSPAEGYPDDGKSKIRAFPGGMHLGVSYEFIRLTPYAEVGFLYTGIREVPGINAAWGTMEAGVFIHLNEDDE